MNVWLYLLLAVVNVYLMFMAIGTPIWIAHFIWVVYCLHKAFDDRRDNVIQVALKSENK